MQDYTAQLVGQFIDSGRVDVKLVDEVKRIIATNIDYARKTWTGYLKDKIVDGTVELLALILDDTDAQKLCEKMNMDDEKCREFWQQIMYEAVDYNYGIGIKYRVNEDKVKEILASVLG